MASTGPLRQAMGPLRSGAGVGVGMSKGAGDSPYLNTKTVFNIYSKFSFLKVHCCFPTSPIYVLLFLLFVLRFIIVQVFHLYYYFQRLYFHLSKMLLHAFSFFKVLDLTPAKHKVF